MACAELIPRLGYHQHQVDDLTPRAEEATRLKDQVDEYRHASERAKKQENVIEKYKKKLEEAAETKRMLKVGLLSLSGVRMHLCFHCDAGSLPLC